MCAVVFVNMYDWITLFKRLNYSIIQVFCGVIGIMINGETIHVCVTYWLVLESNDERKKEA